MEQSAFESELRALEQSGALMPLSFTPRQAWALLMILQNAVLLRLTDTPDDQSFARELATSIEQRLCKTPAMKERAEVVSKSPAWVNPRAPAVNAAEPDPDDSEPEKPPPTRRVTKRR